MQTNGKKTPVLQLLFEFILYTLMFPAVIIKNKYCSVPLHCEKCFGQMIFECERVRTKDMIRISLLIYSKFCLSCQKNEMYQSVDIVPSCLCRAIGL